MDWRQSLTACWNSVALQLPQLQESLSHLGHSLGLGGFGGDAGGSSAVGQEYTLRGRRLRVVRQLGEGGYSFVYLVRQLADAGPSAATSSFMASTALGTQLFALKRVLCGSEDQLREAEREVAVMRRLRHPCLLPLVDAETQQQRTPDGSLRHAVLMLFPVYDEGNLFDFVQQRQQEQQRGQLAAARSSEAHRQLVEMLRIFLQVCAALHAMHSQDPGLAHRDVKPHNVLLRRRQQQQQQQLGGMRGGAGSGSASAGGGSSEGGGYDPMPPLAPPREALPQSSLAQTAEGAPLGEQGWAAEGWQSSSGGGAGWGAAGAGSTAAVIPVEHEGQRQRQQEKQWWAARLLGWQQEYEAVLIDFGSTRPALVEVRSRLEAMAVQEDAERQCTAPYRAPELWDVASSCTIDERVDVWSLGCLLYFTLCGQSPFERSAGEAGGSLMLAVVNGRLSWPEGIAANVPEGVRSLVARCLDTDPSTRPRVAEVAAQADRALASLLL